MEEKKKGIEIVLPPTVQGVYSNFAMIAHSGNEFVMDFAALLPGNPNAVVQNRIVMNPYNAKQVLNALQDNIQKYEAQFGTIGGPAPKSGSMPAAPFPYGLTPKGDA